MSSNTLTTGTWASVDGGCPLRCNLEGSDLANLVIGDDLQSIELLFDAAGMRRLAEVSAQAVAEMDLRFEQEDAQRTAEAGELVGQNGAGS
jgi:hypothetical protein